VTAQRVISAPSCPLNGRIVAGCWEHINAVVVLVDARQTGKVTLTQLADFISVVSLSQIDLSASFGVCGWLDPGDRHRDDTCMFAFGL